MLEFPYAFLEYRSDARQIIRRVSGREEERAMIPDMNPLTAQDIVQQTPQRDRALQLQFEQRTTVD